DRGPHHIHDERRGPSLAEDLLQEAAAWRRDLLRDEGREVAARLADLPHGDLRRQWLVHPVLRLRGRARAAQRLVQEEVRRGTDAPPRGRSRQNKPQKRRQLPPFSDAATSFG